MSDHSPRQELAELQGLIQSLHEGQITADEHARLQQWLRDSEEAAWVYVQYMNLCAGLHWDTTQEPLLELAAPKDASRETRSPLLGFLGECFQQGISFLSRSNVFTLLVAIGLPGLVLLLLMVSLVQQSRQHESVATVVRASDCVGSFGGGYEQLSPGMTLAPGQRLTLRSGVVQIAFADGARAILEAPTAFEPRHGNGGYLQLGRLSATVPPAARGFTIETPLATIIDHGTDFGVCVTSGGTAEAHVFAGRVEVAAKTMPENPTPLVAQLTADQAVRIRADADRLARIETIPASSDAFVRSFPVSLATAPATTRKTENRLLASVTRKGGASDDRVPVGPFDGETAPLPSDETGVRAGALYYSDRAYVFAAIDAPLVGAEYVRTFNSDKTDDGDFAYEVTLTTDRNEVFLMVLVDDRIDERTGKLRFVVDQVTSRFARAGQFVDTGYDIMLEGEGSKNARFSAYGMKVPTRDAGGRPITYVLGATPPDLLEPRYYSNYVIAVMPAVPAAPGPTPRP